MDLVTIIRGILWYSHVYEISSIIKTYLVENLLKLLFVNFSLADWNITIGISRIQHFSIKNFFLKLSMSSISFLRNKNQICSNRGILLSFHVYKYVLGDVCKC